ncbi:MAG: TetR/AcrR family transcriptional regulator [Rhodospirillales bacterium]
MVAAKSRRRAVDELKRGLILEAAARIFETKGLEGASLRAIAAEAGYTPAALYFHFESKEAIYAELLGQSLAAIDRAVTAVVADAKTPEARLRAAALAFFRFYADKPRDLELGFYLMQGGLGPKGLGQAHDQALNRALAACLEPIGKAAQELGLAASATGPFVAAVFAHLCGVLLLAHTGRLRLFGVSAETLVERYLAQEIAGLKASAVA